MVWFLVYDRQQQSEQATASITQGWGGPQAMAGPVLVIPYRATATETVVESGQSVTRSRAGDARTQPGARGRRIDHRHAPGTAQALDLRSGGLRDPQISGKARFAFPPDLARHGVAVADMDLGRAELRFGLSDPRGLGANPRVALDGQPLRLQPGGGSSGGRGFFAWIDANVLNARPLTVDFAYDFRGNGSLALAPQAGDTRWTVRSAWPHPSFGGEFLPAQRRVDEKGFEATYRVGNLALGRSLVSTGDAGASNIIERVAAAVARSDHDRPWPTAARSRPRRSA